MADKQTIKGCCPLDCPDTCAWIAHVEDGKVVRVTGDKDHPFTRGVLCAKVNDYPARTYSPDRLLYPLRRAGKKGSGQFERISWEEAVDTIAARFDQVINEHGAEALMPVTYFGSMGAAQKHAPMRLLNALGASDMHGNICGAPSIAILGDGHEIGFDPEDYIHAKLIILWGVNVLTTGHHHWHFLSEARKRNGARIICIDPRRTRTAAQCDQHIAIRPGSDAALAAGMARILFKENLADLDYAGQIAHDLDAYREQVEPWTPERVAEACGIEAETVISLARDFASAEPAMIRSGIGPQQNAFGESVVWGLSALSILSGHARSKGGGLSIFNLPDINLGLSARADLKQEKTRSLDMTRLSEILNDETAAKPVKGLLVWGTNPAVVLPNSAEIRRGLKREDLFTVVLEHFMTDTAQLADIILPSTTQLEHFDVVSPWGHYYMAANNPAIAPLGESKSHGEIMRLVARRMGLNHPAMQESDEEIAAAGLPPELPLEALKKEGWRKHAPAPAGIPAPDKRISLAGYPAPAATPSRDGAAADSLHLLTPKSHYFLNSSFANMARQQQAEGGPKLEMSSEDAAMRNLADGQSIVIRNGQGTLKTALNISENIRPGTVSLSGKWWSSKDNDDAVGNFLVPSAWSPTGQPAFNDVLVQVESA
ncbi:MAG: molybdopterin-dependent oxidoreductase [Rhodospirillaceae bacterium]|nr:molybdopterin-dependent oxidoreductase [Rhodospirillaceae bacterium]